MGLVSKKGSCLQECYLVESLSGKVWMDLGYKGKYIIFVIQYKL